MEAWGEEFSKSVELLHKEIEEDLKNHSLHVLACAVRHFLRGATIINRFYPIKRLLIIPVNGVSTISGVSLPIDTYCYIGDGPALTGEDIDVIIVAYEETHKSS
ncbi:hypothetical protein N7466_001440 [Penicillium verhagenii]|uniref:uncharacterized protein n=1 Tax=Penicillium verhagenii TaxID=1562060 RepID=UPI0025453DC4|nr:uncharacterized protein N7466_001440 [Penicillium verhagenii]KAJ5938306.1 hypothetical protein N7466_001440 [Penicillium verhagenii]